MIAFAAMLAGFPDTLPAYLAQAPEADRAAAHALLSGQRPRRVAGLDAVLHWAAEVAGVPDWLVAASLAASGDRAETAALMLPPATGTPPTLAEVIAALDRATPITAHSTLLALWSRLPPLANHTLNRLASGTFRTTYPAPATPPSGPGGSVLAVMILAQAASPDITLAQWQDTTPIPIARLPLTLPQTPQIMAWVRANVAGRFGPVRQVPPVHVFRITFQGLTRNARRKSGYELHGAQIVEWLPEGQADGIAVLDTLAAQHGL
jgi:hypothetical protein